MSLQQDVKKLMLVFGVDEITEAPGDHPSQVIISTVPKLVKERALEFEKALKTITPAMYDVKVDYE